MKPIILRRPVRKLMLTYSPALLFLLLGVVLCCGSSLYMIGSLRAHGFSFILCLAILLMFVFAIAFFYGFLLNLWDLCTQVTMTDIGITVRRFGRRLLFLSWSDLAEVGIALETIKGDRHRCLYFSNRQWDEPERCCVGLIAPARRGILGAFDIFDRSGSIWIRCNQLENKLLLKKLCPLPLPSTDSCRNGKSEYSLMSYRRKRLADGSWSAPSSSFLQANVFFSRFSSRREWLAFVKQRKKQKKL